MRPTQAHDSKFCVITERGRDLLSWPRPQALDWARAVAALNHPLHQRLQNAGVDATFRSGQLDTAIRDAYRDVEHVVREMSRLQQLNRLSR